MESGPRRGDGERSRGARVPPELRRRLLEMLLRIVVEHAGAGEGVVLLVRKDRLSTAAAISTSSGAARLLDAGEAAAALPQSILNYVLRSHERVLLDDAAARHPFSEDAYFGRKRPRSVLCLPIMRQARLLGVPYIPVTPFFPWLGPLGMIPLPSKWLIEFGEPIRTDSYDEGAADDPMLVFNVTDQVRETIQQTLYTLLMQRRSVFS